MNILKKLFNKKNSMDYFINGENVKFSEELQTGIVLDNIDKENGEYIIERFFELLNEKLDKKNIKGSLRICLEKLNEEFLGKYENVSIQVFSKLEEKKINILNMGNIRFYVYSNNEIRQITEDDTEFFKLFKNNMIDYSKAKDSPLANILTNSLGKNKNNYVNTYEYFIQQGDKIIILNSKAYNRIGETRLENILTGNINFEKLKEIFNENENVFLKKCK
ncbi:MAG: family protein phosphatase [Fusobacteriaceae bacterium]|jgi:serine/threonine protein phosphatase PrpC|nr:protein serine/threonine phosphatase [Fusobacteriales bacterium]MDN5304831.1 family protein phosphatase [Fusobacteriaceae bacterium]